MINSKVDHCETLEEFYSEIRRQQEEAHGDKYCEQHDIIRQLLWDECNTYKELGTHQGGTAAVACLQDPKKVELVDISMEKFNKSKHLFEDYCDNHKVELVVKEMDSTEKRSASRTDLLVIDSLHHPNHLMKELRLHADYVAKYIVCHDTSMLHGRKDDRLWVALQQFTSELNPWEIIDRRTDNVGVTVLKRAV